MILCRRNPKDLFFRKKKCVGGSRGTEYGDLALFHSNFPINPTQPKLSNIMVTWKQYEHVTMNQPYSSKLTPKRINFLEDNVYVSTFLF